MAKDPYEVLGVAKNATDAEIKSAYRSLAKRYHPDKNKGDASAAERFKEIGEAYAILSDPEKRAQYDQFGGSFPGGFPGGGFSGAGGGGFGDFADLFGDMFSGGRGSSLGGFSGGRVRIEDLFGGFGGPFAEEEPRPRGMQAIISLSMKEAFSGGEQTLNFQGERIEVNLPAGVRDGDKLRLPGKAPGGAALVLVIKVQDDQRFALEGDDIYTTTDVPAPVAVLGGKARVETLGGSLNLTIPAGTSGKKKMRLRGQGWPSKNGARGDLYVELNLIVPANPSEAQKELYRQLLALG